MVRIISIDVGEDGTNDSVHIEICSDVDSTCCTKLLDSFFNDFKSNKSNCNELRWYKVEDQVYQFIQFTNLQTVQVRPSLNTLQAPVKRSGLLMMLETAH